MPYARAQDLLVYEDMSHDEQSLKKFGTYMWVISLFISFTDNLLESLEVCQLSSLVQTIHRQCEGGGESEEMKEEASQ